MKAADLFEAIKSSVFDIIGFLLPGFYALILLNYTFEISFNNYSDLESEWILLIIAYILGYVIFSLSEEIEKKPKIRPPRCLKKYIIDQRAEGKSKILTSISYKMSIKLLNEHFKDHLDAPSQFDSADVNTLRSIVMSFCPESDTKIYMFRFRGELCRNISLYSIAHFFLTLLAIFCKLIFEWNIVNQSTSLYLMLLVLPVTSYLLLKGYFRFVRIADSIPFSIFIATYSKK